MKFRVYLLLLMLTLYGCAMEPNIGKIPDKHTVPLKSPEVLNPTAPEIVVLNSSAPVPAAAPAPRIVADTTAMSMTSSDILTTTSSYPLLLLKQKDKITLVRDYAYPNDKKIGKSFNTLLFPKRPVTKEDFERYGFICEQWKASFELKSDIVVIPKDVKLVPFYWLLNKPKKSESCSDLVNDYDYSKAQTLSRQFNLDITKTFIVFSHDNTLVTMLIDSNLTFKDIELSIETWKKTMTVVPSKSSLVSIYNLVYSAKAVLGVLGALITFRG